MAALPPDFIADILLLGRAGPRLLNESGVLLTVWSAYAEDRTDAAGREVPVDLLLTPMESLPSADLARTLYELLRETPVPRDMPRLITPVQGAVVARLGFDDFLRFVLPFTGLDLAGAILELEALAIAARDQTRPVTEAGHQPPSLGELHLFALSHNQAMTPELRTALVVATIATARGLGGDGPLIGRISWRDFWRRPEPMTEAQRALFTARRGPSILSRIVAADEPLIWRVSTNRPVEEMGISIETIKADAARRVFEVDCRSLTWAVIDSGIDGSHPAFRDHDAGDHAIRVDKAYDFGSLRRLAAYDILFDPEHDEGSVRLIRDRLHMEPEAARVWVDQLKDDAREGRPYDWAALSALLEVPPDQLPAHGDKPNPHGTHVAGVLAGDWRDGERNVYRGVCPTLRLYDLRILGEDDAATEFAIIAALAFIRWLNSRNRYMVIHGVNMSVGLKHELESYACGRTPVCIACEATISTGVPVIAAAGNWGSQDFLLSGGGSYRGYAPISIADPGNAASVITVGATHRERPHEYGVSFFSSRGPTGDGRAKPDVVAPGERIDGPLPDLGFGRLDGTSMAAPHVSGIAALLMARNPEMIGNPARVKDVIVATATDLGRERHFQGAGLVDALRALQAV
jgi:hypothetical protein